MPRMFHGGPDAVDPDIYAADAVSEDEKDMMSKRARLHHPISRPAADRLKLVDGKLKLKRPGMFCKTDVEGNAVAHFDDWEPGSLALSVPGYGYWVIPPGGHVDLDVSVPLDAVKANAPHLLTEEEMAAVKDAKAKREGKAFVEAAPKSKK
jgi:hypothetical protein